MIEQRGVKATHTVDTPLRLNSVTFTAPRVPPAEPDDILQPGIIVRFTDDDAKFPALHDDLNRPYSLR